MESRVRPEQKSRIEMAAYLRGQSVSDFMVQHADQAAMEVIEQERVWKVSERDSIAFVEALMNPPEPNERLRREMKEFLAGRHG